MHTTDNFSALIKANLPDSALDKAKKAAEKATDSQKRHKVREFKSFIQSNHQRPQEIEDVKANNVDSPVGRSEDDLESSRMESSGTGCPDSPKKKQSITSRPLSSASRHSFQVKKVSQTNPPATQPMKVERKTTAIQVEDEIEALLKSPMDNPNEHSSGVKDALLKSPMDNLCEHSTGVKDALAESTRSLPPLSQKSPSVQSNPPLFSGASPSEEMETPKNRENIRARSVAGMKLNNHAILETLEGQTFKEEPQRKTGIQESPIRPQTAGVGGHSGQLSNTKGQKEQELVNTKIENSNKLIAAKGRGGSAPLLFKSFEEHEIEDFENSLDFSAMKKKKKRRKKASDDAEIMSISDMEDLDAPPLEREASTVSDTGAETLPNMGNQSVPPRASSATVKSRPPSSLNRFRSNLPSKTPGKTGSAGSLYSSGAGTGEDDNGSSDDEEVKRILEMRKAGAQVRPRTGQAVQRQAPPSAKSRDSGYLGDSYPTNGALWRNKDPALTTSATETFTTEERQPEESETVS